ncbi:FAD-dependent oxidoreductase, partial [Mycobacterium tuberculosis]|nr:FAD-dependent oxidoreductase [Mycobacterium tuberculosis]
KRIAVIGAGLAGCTAAFDLALKGHTVTVYEAGDRAVDRLYLDYADALPPSAIAADLGQLDTLGVTWCFRARVTTGTGVTGL